MTYIVECSICSQPWEVPRPLYAVPGHSWLQVPAHAMLHGSTGDPMPFGCPGVQHSAIGFGDREQWEKNWSLRKPDRPLPDVLDGTPVTIVSI